MTNNNQNQLSQADLLVKFIEQDPSCSEVLEVTKQGKTLTPKTQSLLEKTASLFIASPEDFYGKVYVTNELKKHANLTAHTNTIANLVDFISNAPFYYFSFQFLGNIPAIILGLFLDSGVLYFSNITASTAANRNQKNRSWANIGMVGMISISIVKSLVSGIGVELLNNPTGIQEEAANYLIAEQKQKVNDLKTLDSPQYNNAKKQCEIGEANLKNLSKNDPKYHSEYVKYRGKWSEMDKKWDNVPLEQIPVCIRATRLEKDNYTVYENAKNNLNKKLTRRTEIGNDLTFLKQEFPEVYNFNFDDNGNLKSPVTQVQMATLSFFGKLSRGEVANLGFALFFFSLSIITSAAAVFITITYSCREDVLKSRDENFARQRDLELEKIYQELLTQNNQENHLS
jgi:hypothetical protein